MQLSVPLFYWSTSHFMGFITQDGFACRRIERQLNHGDFPGFKSGWSWVISTCSLQCQIKERNESLLNRPGGAFAVQPKCGDKEFALQFRSLEKQSGAAPGK